MKKNKYLQLGDLVDLRGLKKPEEGVLTVELGGPDVKQANVEQLGTSMSDLARKIEGNEDVSVRALIGLVKATKKALEHKLLPEIAEKLLETLRNRFENSENMRRRHPGIKWAKVQAKLEASPDKLWSLHEMERTKGEPDVTGIDPQTKEYIFMDCSVESPEDRRDCVYDMEGEIELKKRNPSANSKSNAAGMAALMGVDILNEEEYRELQTKGEFDRNTWSWLKTPVDKRIAGVALIGDRNRDGVRFLELFAYTLNDSRAWRGSLRV